MLPYQEDLFEIGQIHRARWALERKATWKTIKSTKISLAFKISLALTSHQIEASFCSNQAENHYGECADIVDFLS